MKTNKVAISMLNWNGIKNTIACLESLKKIGYNNYKIYLADNGSKPDEAGNIEKRFRDIKVIRNKANLGFCRGNNENIRKALTRKFDFILLLNNDIIVDAMFLQKMLDASRQANASIVGAAMYDLRKKNLVNTGFNISIIRSLPIGIKDTSKEIKEVEMVSGACMLIRKEVFQKVGFLNEEYFAFFEDAEFCIKAKEAGYKIICATNAKVFHDYRRWYERERDKRTYRLFTRNRLMFNRKNGKDYERILFWIYFIGFVIPKHIVVSLINGKIESLLSFMGGISDYVLRKDPEESLLK